MGCGIGHGCFRSGSVHWSLAGAQGWPAAAVQAGIARARWNEPKELFNRYGVWTIIVAAIHAHPVQGVYDTGRHHEPSRSIRFLLASLIGREEHGLMTIGVLVFIFGEEIQEFIEGNFELLTIGGGCGDWWLWWLGGLVYRGWASRASVADIDTQPADS